jgi:hypothetical protein
MGMAGSFGSSLADEPGKPKTGILKRVGEKFY